MPAARLFPLLIVAGMVAGACSADNSVDTESIESIPPVTTQLVGEPPSPEVPAVTEPETSTTTSAPPTTTAEEPVDTSPGEIRAADTALDDPLYPDLGSPDVDVISYDIRLDVDVQGGSFDAVVGVVADVVPGVFELPLDAQGFVVDSVTIDGADAVFTQLDTELVIDLPDDRAERVEAEISYSASPNAGESSGVIPAGWFLTEDGSYVLNEPDGARSWMPANDHPTDKATWRFEITVPDDLAAIANGVNVQAGGAGLPWIWEMNEPMATYLVLLAIGDYVIVESPPIPSIDGGTIPILNVALRDRVDDMKTFFDQTSSQMAYFEGLFGPYPLDGYGLAFLDSVPGLAMETQGRSYFSVSDFSGGVNYLTQLLQAHELAHQWFGNAVSPASWSDIWLNEAFATYAQWMWLQEVQMERIDSQVSRTLPQRQGGSVSTGDPSVESLFGFESYDGGAVIVHALRLTIGDDKFFELLQRWVAENAGTAQTTEAFIALAEAVSFQDLTQFFDDWLFATDLPQLLPG